MAKTCLIRVLVILEASTLMRHDHCWAQSACTCAFQEKGQPMPAKLNELAKNARFVPAPGTFEAIASFCEQYSQNESDRVATVATLSAGLSRGDRGLLVPGAPAGPPPQHGGGGEGGRPGRPTRPGAAGAGRQRAGADRVRPRRHARDPREPVAVRHRPRGQHRPRGRGRQGGGGNPPAPPGRLGGGVYRHRRPVLRLLEGRRPRG